MLQGESVGGNSLSRNVNGIAMLCIGMCGTECVMTVINGVLV